MGAVMLALSANMLGLGNAATPLGLKAMEELQALDSQPYRGERRDADLFGIDHGRSYVGSHDGCGAACGPRLLGSDRDCRHDDVCDHFRHDRSRNV